MLVALGACSTTASPGTTASPETAGEATATTVRSSTTAGAAPAASAIDAELIAAADAGDLAAVERLLAAGASVRATDNRGRTALIAASYGAHLELAERLIAAGSDVNTQDDSQQSAYLIATSEIGPDDGLALLRLTLAHGADVTDLDSYNGTGLIRAAHRGYHGIVAELLAAGVPIDHVNGLHWTALLEAIVLGLGGPDHTEVVRLLVDAGANLQLTDGDGFTPLQLAQARGQQNIVAILQAAGAR